MIRAYLKEKIKRILLDFAFIGIFTLCFYLTEVSLYFIWYPSALCFVLYFLYIVWDYRKFSKKHKHLLKLVQHIDETAEQLPAAVGQLEEDYQLLVKTVLTSYKKSGKIHTENTKNRQEYIALWTHQIKTPITAMELLLQKPDEKNFDTIRRELSERLFEIEQYVDTSLQYMRLDTMNSDLVLKKYHLFDIVKQAVKYFSRSFISKRISLRLEESDIFVATDEKWLLFVLKQILSNALKYTKQGTVSIYMNPKGNQTLVIEDTGIGILAEDLPRIYEKGFTGCNGRIQKKSTGIGLYLSKTVLDKLGHGISISSEEGHGTRVEISFEQPKNLFQFDTGMYWVSPNTNLSSSEE